MSWSQGSQALNWRHICCLSSSASSSSLRRVGKGVTERALRPAWYVFSAELLDAVSQAAQKYEALYMGTLPVTKAMGED